MRYDLSRRLRRPQQGFTLIELIVVIVILGILAATAVPQMIDLRREAQLAVLQGTATAINSATATNFVASQLPNPPEGVVSIVSGRENCWDLDDFLVGDGSDVGNNADVNLPDDVQWVNRRLAITCDPAIGGVSRECRLRHAGLTAEDADTVPVQVTCTRAF